MLRLQREQGATKLLPLNPPISIISLKWMSWLTFATEVFGPRYSDPIAIAFSSKGCVHSRKINVDLWSTGNVGTKRTKNICKHSSKKTDVTEVASTAAVTLEDYTSHELRTQFVYLERTYKCRNHLTDIMHCLMALAGRYGSN